jgi:hypothetical protein
MPERFLTIDQIFNIVPADYDEVPREVLLL